MNSHLWLPHASAPATPGDFASYLLGSGWILTKTDDSWATFERDADKVAVEVPQRTSVRDYARLVGFLLDDLARVEARPASSILRDVKASSMDVVRLGIQGSSTRDGRIPVEAGMRAYEAARDLLLAARDDDLSAVRMRDTVVAAIVVEQPLALDAEARLERTLRVVDAGVDQFGIAGAGVLADAVLGLEDQHLATGECQFAGDGEAHHAGADHGAVDAFCHGENRRLGRCRSTFAAGPELTAIRQAC